MKLAINAIGGSPAATYGHLQVVFGDDEIEVNPSGVFVLGNWDVTNVGPHSAQTLGFGDPSLYNSVSLAPLVGQTEQEFWQLLQNIANAIDNSRQIRYFNNPVQDENGNPVPDAGGVFPEIAEAGTQNSNTFINSLLYAAGVDLAPYLPQLYAGTNLDNAPGHTNNVLFSTLSGDALNLTFAGSEGDDVIQLGYGEDSVAGGLGDDAIQGNRGNDILFGDGGDDIIYGDVQGSIDPNDAFSDFIDGGTGQDILFGGGANDTLVGSEGNDTIFGGIGSDQIFGGDGDDRIGFDGEDTEVRGGNGFDTAIFDDSGDQQSIPLTLTANADEMEVELLLGGDGDDVLTTELEAMLGGGDGDDKLVAAQTARSAILWGGEGADQFVVSGGYNIFVATIEGLDASNFDQLRPEDVFGQMDPSLRSFVDVVIVNPDETDTIIQRYAAGSVGQYTPMQQDFVLAVTQGIYYDNWNAEDYLAFDNPLFGQHVYEPTGVADRSLVWEGDRTFGQQTINLQGHGNYTDGIPDIELGRGLGLGGGGFAPATGWTISGARMNGSTIKVNDQSKLGIQFGSDGDDTLDGSAGDDLFFGTNGIDKIRNAGGNDKITFRNSDERKDINLNDQSVKGEKGSTDIDQIKNVEGTNFDDRFEGDAFDNTFDGSNGDDVFFGGAGDDEIIDGAGIDTISGGRGNDRFVLVAGDGAQDVVTDFTIGEDIIDLSGWESTRFGDLSFAAAGADVEGGSAGVVVSNGDESFVISNLALNDVPQLSAQDFAVDTGVTPPSFLGGPVFGTSENDVIDDSWSGSNQVNDLGQYISAGDGNDSIYDGDGIDHVFGGSGADRFFAGDGADFYDGGDDHRDEVLYLTSSEGLTIDMVNSSNSTGIAAGDTYTNIERVRATNYDDVIVLADDIDLNDGRGGNDDITDGYAREVIRGGAGADTFRFVAGDGTTDIIADFSVGEDVIDISLWGITFMSQLEIVSRLNADGSLRSGVLVSFGEEELLIANLENADITTLSATDFGLIDDMPDDPVAVGNGTVEGTSGSDIINDAFIDADGEGIAEDGQYIIAGAGNDSIYDGAGDDTIFGGDGADRFFAGDGADFYHGGDDHRDEVLYIYESQGLTVNMIDAQQSTGVAFGDTFIDIERIKTTNHDDVVVLADDVDLTDARGGDDDITDGNAREVIRGGAGADTFRFVADDGQTDIVADFSIGDDLIDLSLWGASGLNDLTFIGRTNSDGSARNGVFVSYENEELLLGNLQHADMTSLTEDSFIFL